jgi:hypothetical protein
MLTSNNILLENKIKDFSEHRLGLDSFNETQPVKDENNTINN